MHSNYLPSYDHPEWKEFKLIIVKMFFFCRHLALLTDNVGLGQSPTQEAIVQSFLKNYDKAIAALNAATRKTPSTALYTLLGKTQMKAQYWQDAANSFQKALDLVVSGKYTRFLASCQCVTSQNVKIYNKIRYYFSNQT